MADKGIRQALSEDAGLLNGLNINKGDVTYKAVAEELGYDYVPPKAILENRIGT